MKAKPSDRPIETTVTGTGDLPISTRKPTCESIAEAQNAHLARLCAKKKNTLSCRCSGCDSDDKYPVIASANDAPLLNTAYNGSGGVLTSGFDSHWEVGKGQANNAPPNVPPSIGVTSWSPASIVPAGKKPSSWAVSPFGNADWISNSNVTGDDLYFRYTFNLSSSADPNTFAVKMNFFADNRVWEIYVNDVAQTSGLPQFGAGVGPLVQTLGFEAGNQVSITLNNSWKQCENQIVVHVKSPGGETGFLAQNAVEVKPDEDGCDCHCECSEFKFPALKPCINVSWGDSDCDCLETDDVEILCITVCNCYSNVSFGCFSIGQILVTDMAGNPVPTLPDGTPSVQVIPSGPICFGDIPPCKDKNHPGCVSRELVLYTRGAIGKTYKLLFNGICFKVCHQFQSEQCFTMDLCQD